MNQLNPSERDRKIIERQREQNKLNLHLNANSVDRKVDSILDLNMNELKTYIQSKMNNKIPDTNELNTILLFKILERYLYS